MIKFSIKAIIFSTIVFLLVLFSGHCFLNKENVQSFKNLEYKKLNGGIDIAFFGSSHAFSSYDPRVIENELNVSVYNYGVAAQNLVTTKALAKQELDKENLKLGIVDIFWETLREPPFSPRIANFQLQSIDYMDFSVNKVELFKDVYGTDSLLNMFPTIREHAVWKDRFFQPKYYLKNDIDFYKGFKPQLYFNKKIWENLVKDEEGNELNKLDLSYQITTGQKKIIDDIIELFKTKNVPLLFVSAPIHKNYMDAKYYTYQYRIKEYLKGKNVLYIDYNDFWNELELHLYDYKDESHLNTNGALKVSEHLAKYIKEQYDFNSELKSKKYLYPNRYSIIENPKDNAVKFRKIINTKAGKETGVDELIIFKDNYERLEILLIGERLTDLNIKVEYEIDEFKEKNLARELRKFFKNGKFTIKEFLPNRKKEGLYNGLNFKGNEFKVLIVDCPFNEIYNLKIALGEKDSKETILKIEHFELN